MAWQKMERVTKRPVLPTWQEVVESSKLYGKEIPKGQAKKFLRTFEKQERWENNLYRAQVHPTPSLSKGENPWNVTEVSITRVDQEAIHDWRHFQYIKNDIFGDDREAVELYPVEARLMDTANTYWLYVLPEGKIFPFGLTGRHVNDSWGLAASKQRPFG